MLEVFNVVMSDSFTVSLLIVALVAFNFSVVVSVALTVSDVTFAALSKGVSICTFAFSVSTVNVPISQFSISIVFALRLLMSASKIVAVPMLAVSTVAFFVIRLSVICITSATAFLMFTSSFTVIVVKLPSVIFASTASNKLEILAFDALMFWASKVIVLIPLEFAALYSSM